MIQRGDFAIVGFLVFLEGILSLDNALVLAMIARKLPQHQQRKALTYGLVGAVLFRIVAISLAVFLMKWFWVKWIGGGYLFYVAGKHLMRRGPQEATGHEKRSFFRTVLAIELTDIAFAVDSVLAAVAVSKKFWVIFIGGFIGVVLMRFAATGFMALLRRFPGFDDAAYLLVGLIGAKLALEGFQLPGLDFEDASGWAFWVFWICLALCVCSGFRRSSSLRLPKTPPITRR